MRIPDETVTERLSVFLADLPRREISGELRELAELHLLDTLGAGIAGAASEEAIVAGRTRPAPGGAVVWAAGRTADARSAAFLNGIASHAFELDDCHGCDHSGAVVVPAAIAALALSEEPVPGGLLLRAIVAGYDVGRRVQTALGGYDEVNERGWHSTGVCGVFAAAAAAGTVLRLDADRFASAIGLAGSSAGGSWAFMSDGAMSKRLHVGRAAELGLDAAVLARSGFTGPHDLFEAPWGGFLDLYGGPSRTADALVDGLGTRWEIAVSAIKPYASCRGTHSAVDACLRIMRENELAPEEVEQISVETSAFLQAMCGGADVGSLVSAQLSMPFALASAAQYGSVGLDEIVAERRSSHETIRMMERIVVETSSARHGGMALPRVTIRARGHEFTREGRDALGSAENPLNRDQVTAKFLALTRRNFPQETARSVAGTAFSALTDVRGWDGALATTGAPPVLR